MCGLLGASPGASISVQVDFDVLKTLLPSKMAGWTPKLTEMMLSFGESLNDNARNGNAWRHGVGYTAQGSCSSTRTRSDEPAGQHEVNVVVVISRHVYSTL